MLGLSPADFRFARSRWSCEAAAVVLREDYRVRVGRETVRLWLRSAGLVWRRPRPTIRPKDPDRGKKLATLRRLLRHLPDDETAVLVDEVDVNLNPKVGCQWMRRGEQAAVETPGNNEKRYLAGSIHWRTGRVILTEGKPKEGRGAALFLRHLDDLRRAFRHYKVSHVLCDNAGTHTPEGSKLVRAYLKEWGRRVRVHYLPKYSPDTNPIERVWWRLHEAVTRNHRCQSIDELLDLTFDWFETRAHFRVQSSVYTGKPGNEAHFRLWREVSSGAGAAQRRSTRRRRTGPAPTGRPSSARNSPTRWLSGPRDCNTKDGHYDFDSVNRGRLIKA
ncbi:MAG: IS630 family transposase [Gemmataceae bacterium]